MTTATTLYALLALTVMTGADPCYNNNDDDNEIFACPTSLAIIGCSHFPTLESFSPLRRKNTKIPIVYISNCPLPTTSYADAFEKLNINVSSITDLVISNATTLTAKHLEGLKLKTLNFDRSLNTNEVLTLDEKFFEPLETLKQLYASNMNISPMPEASNLLAVSLNYTNISGDWGGCENVKVVDLTKTNVTQTGLFANCMKLQHLSLYDMTEDSVLRSLSEVRTLTKINIVNCGLSKLPRDLFANTDLLKISLMENKLTAIRSLKSLTQLEELDLSMNPLESAEELTETLVSLRGLRSMRLQDIEFSSSCGKLNLVITKASDKATYAIGDTDDFTCSFTTQKPNCVPINVLQLHLLTDEEEPSFDTWNAAASNSVTLRIRLMKEDDDTTLVCRGVFHKETLLTEITLLVDNEDSEITSLKDDQSLDTTTTKDVEDA